MYIITLFPCSAVYGNPSSVYLFAISMQTLCITAVSPADFSLPNFQLFYVSMFLSFLSGFLLGSINRAVVAVASDGNRF